MFFKAINSFFMLLLVFFLSIKIVNASFGAIGSSMGVFPVKTEDRKYYAIASLNIYLQYFTEDIERKTGQKVSDYLFCYLPALLITPYPWIAGSINYAYHNEERLYFPAVEGGLFFIGSKIGIGHSFINEFDLTNKQKSYFYWGSIYPSLIDTDDNLFIVEPFLRLYFAGFDDGFLIYNANLYEIGIKIGLLFY